MEVYCKGRAGLPQRFWEYVTVRSYDTKEIKRLTSLGFVKSNKKPEHTSYEEKPSRKISAPQKEQQNAHRSRYSNIRGSLQ
jgi:hypothetical protein